MNKLLMTTATLIALATPAMATDLPACNSPDIYKAVYRMIEGWKFGAGVGYITDLKASAADKRWCQANVSVAVRGTRFSPGPSKSGVLTYTIEWIDEDDGRYFIQAAGLNLR